MYENDKTACIFLFDSVQKHQKVRQKQQSHQLHSWTF